jgi:hypothetical protein
VVAHQPGNLEGARVSVCGDDAGGHDLAEAHDAYATRA